MQTGQSDGNIIINSGSTYPLLESRLSSKVEALVKKSMGLKAVQNPPGGFKLCFPKEAKGVDLVLHILRVLTVS